MKRALFTIVTVVFATALALLAAEAGFRLISRGSTNRETKPRVEETRGEERPQAARWTYYTTPWFYPFEARPTLLRGLCLPFSEERVFGARHNSNGFRGPEYTIGRPPGVFRIIVLGESHTWGQGVRSEETFPSVLEDRLRTAGLRNGATPEVINLGVCGHRVLDQLIKLVAHGESLSPDLVVVQMSGEDLDFYPLESIRSSWQSVAPPMLQRSLTKISFLKALGQSLSNLSLVRWRKSSYGSASPEWRDFVETLGALGDWRIRKGVPVAFVAFPYVDSKTEGSPFDYLGAPPWTPLREMTALLERALAEVDGRGFPTLFLLDAMQKAGGDALTVSRLDSHPNARAHRLAAETLEAFLEKEGLLPRADEKSGATDPDWAIEDALRREASENWLALNQSFAEQERFFRRLLELRPRDSWVVGSLAEVSRQSGRSEEAFRLYESLPVLAPEAAAPWYHMAMLTGNAPEKRRLLELMLQRVPDHTSAMEDLARIDFAEGRQEDGCRLLARVAQIANYEELLRRTLAGLDEHGCRVEPSPLMQGF